MGHNDWISLLLNILKLTGVALSGIAGVIATLSETKTLDKKHLTNAGKWLLTLGIVGFAVAFSAQSVEWLRSKSDAEATEARNAQTLLEIRRAVTRLESASVDLVIYWPVKDIGIATYAANVHKLVEHINELSPSQGGNVGKGLWAMTLQGESIQSLLATSDSIALPRPHLDGLAGRYRELLHPYIAFFKTPIDPTMFAVNSAEGLHPSADLIFMPTGGAESATLYVNEHGELESMEYERTGMEVAPSMWRSSGVVMSLEDLTGCQAIIYLSGQADTVQSLWRMHAPSITLHLNHQDVQISPNALKLSKGAYGQYVYSYILPGMK